MLLAWKHFLFMGIGSCEFREQRRALCPTQESTKFDKGGNEEEGGQHPRHSREEDQITSDNLLDREDDNDGTIFDLKYMGSTGTELMPNSEDYPAYYHFHTDFFGKAPAVYNCVDKEKGT